LNVEDVIIKKWKHLAVAPDKMLCDFYEMLNGDSKAINTYTGEFMSQYTWAENLSHICRNVLNPLLEASY